MKGIWRSNPYGPLFWPSENARDAEIDLGITRLYEPLMRKRPDTGKYVFNELQVNPKYAADISGRFEYALYYDVSWDSDIVADSIVKKMHDAFMLTAPHCKSVMFDIEYHFCSKLIIDIITKWRALHPTGPISWTMEPFQAGWMTQELVKKVNADPNMVLVVQDFYGNMTPAGTRNGKTPQQELQGIGYAINRIKLFVNGALVNQWKDFWDGCILSEETLPSYNT